ncbi:MAG: electron transfer flavoprotein alpha/beta- subunit [Halobacteriales archaeon]
MRAVVTARPTPHRVDATEDGIDPYRWNLGLLDKVAVEAGLQIADEVVVVGIGGERARKAVRSALRMGADDALLVEYDPINETVGEKYAKVVARAAGRERPDALFVGEASPVTGVEIVTMAVDHLGWPAVSRATAIGEAVAADVDTADDELAIQRKLATGRQEIVAAEPPMVVGVDGGFANPRRAPLDAVLAGGETEIRTVDLETIAPSESRFSMSVGDADIESITANERWGRGRPPRSGGVEERIRRMLGRDAGGGGDSGTIVDGASPEAAADRVVEYLRTNDLL